MAEKRNLKNYLDALVDKDGIKTEVTITMTNQTMQKLIFGMIIAGLSLTLINKIIKVYFPDRQLIGIQSELQHIKSLLAQK